MISSESSLGTHQTELAQASDGELLRRYAEDRSESAFREVVRRHVNLVYSASLRRANGRTDVAADTTQAVFTALARQAASLSRHALLSGWLHAATRNATLNALRAERRRQRYEQEAHAMQELTAGNHAEWDRVRPILDELLDDLAAADRDAVLWRYFERRSYAEIGSNLHVSVDAARMRVERALGKLRAGLSRRGITSTSEALAAVLAAEAVTAAPAGLLTSVTGASLAGVAGGEGVTAALASFASSKITALLALAAALIISTAFYLSRQARATETAVAAGRADLARQRAQLVGLGSRAQAAERALADRQKATPVAAVTPPTPPPAATPDKAAAAKQQKALQEFLQSNAGLRQLQRDANRVEARMANGAFFRSLGFSPDQVDRAVELNFEAAQLDKDRAAAGVKAPPAWPPYERFREVFGEAAGDRYREYMKTKWSEEEAIVTGFSAGRYYADDPLTPIQSRRLLDIFTNARVNPRGLNSDFDWNRVLVEAEAVLTSNQFKDLQTRALQARNAAMLAEAQK